MRQGGRELRERKWNKQTKKRETKEERRDFHSGLRR